MGREADIKKKLRSYKKNLILSVMRQIVCIRKRKEKTTMIK